MKRFFTLVLIVMIVFSGVSFAEKVITRTHSSLYTTNSQCNGGKFDKVMYLGSDGYELTDTFKNSDKRFVWQINTPSSWISLYNNSSNVLSFRGGYSSAFDFYSNGKPHNVNTVIVVGARGGAKINNIPSNYKRYQIAAQVVYHIDRTYFPYIAGTKNTMQFLDYNNIGVGTQTYKFNAGFPPRNENDNECLNIHVGFCGDGILDNSSTSSSTNINAPLKGGEICDPKDSSKSGWGTATVGCSTTCQPINKKTYDLALRKTVSSSTPGPFKAGDTVKFDIEVFNQGEIDAHNVEVTDYGLLKKLIPGELLNCLAQDDYQSCVKDATNIDALLKDTSWTNRNRKYYKTIAKIPAGESRILSIAFQIPSSYATGAEVRNTAEISKNDGDDCDSIPDNHPSNDKVIDDKIGGRCDTDPNDEDDHDIAVITIEKPTPVIGVSKVIRSQDKVEYNKVKGIRIDYSININNSNNPKNPVIIDKFPSNMCLLGIRGKYLYTRFISVSKDNGRTWIKQDTTLDEKYDCGITHIRYVLTDQNRRQSVWYFDVVGFIPEDNYTDGQKFCNHVVYSADDIQYTEDEVCTTVTKEKTYDLALRKTVSSSTPGPFKAGDTVKFDIEVFNQGEIDAHNIEVVDYVPTGMEVVDSGWTVSGNKATKPIVSLKAGQSTILSISMKIKENFTGTSIKNISEISKDDGDDVDSIPDSDANNDCAVIDDKVNGVCPTDEDDHDIAVITIGKEKLAITKKIVSNGKGDIYLPGEEVTFKITVKNNGTLIVDNIAVKDFMPQSLTYVSSKITSNHTATLTEKVNGDDFTYTNLRLKSGETFVFEVVGKVKINPSQNTTTNCATVTSHNIGPVCDKFNLSPKPELDKTQKVNNSGSYVDAVLKVEESDTVNYKIVFKNTGSATSHDNQLIDKLPRCMSYVDGSARIDLPAGYTFKTTVEQGADKLIYSNFDMKPGQTVTLTLNAKIKDTDNCAADDYKNTAIGRFGQDTLTDDVVVKPETKEEELGCEIDVEDDSIEIDEDDDERVEVTCETENGERAKRITIICDNDDNDEYHKNDTRSYTHYCKYNEDDEGKVHPRCEIKGEDEDYSCKETIDIDVDEDEDNCGNGEKDRGEECDWGNHTKRLGLFDDLFKYDRNSDILKDWLKDEYGSDWKDEYNETDTRSYKCTKSCEIEYDNSNDSDVIASLPRCLSTDVPISVQRGEKYPFWWRLEKSGIEFGNSCDKIKEKNYDSQDNTIIDNGQNLVCYFKVYDAKGNEVDRFEKPGSECYRGSNLNQQKNGIYKFFFDTESSNKGFETIDKGGYNWHIKKANGKTLRGVTPNYRLNGEYKLVLEKVKSRFCNPITGKWKKAPIYNRVCEVNFTVTEPYLIQKGLYGLFPVARNMSQDFFHNFYEMNDTYPLFGISKFNKYLGNSEIVNDQDYKLTSDLKKKIESFKNKYKKLAVKYDNNISKVPGKNIFFTDGDLTIEGNNNYVSTKYTIIVNGTVTVKGSIKTNGMIIADKIKFEDKSSDSTYRCEKGGQTVQGIFIALDQNGFEGDDDKNLNNAEDKERCNYGNLKVKGVLIGNKIKKLVTQKRSHLNGWFWVETKAQGDQKKIDEERRKEIFDGAAVLIEYNPYLWTDLPPGAKDFINALSIYKS